MSPQPKAPLHWSGGWKRAEAPGSGSEAFGSLPHRGPWSSKGLWDTALHSPRSERDALKNWCDAADIALAFKTVHRIEDFDQIVEALGRDQPPFVHIICHGDHDDDDRPYLLFAPKPKKRNRIYLDAPETHTAFRRCFERAERPLLRVSGGEVRPSHR